MSHLRPGSPAPQTGSRYPKPISISVVDSGHYLLLQHSMLSFSERRIRGGHAARRALLRTAECYRYELELQLMFGIEQHEES
jgi:hypothetical protein